MKFGKRTYGQFAYNSNIAAAEVMNEA
jgi:hypothetical protein